MSYAFHTSFIDPSYKIRQAVSHGPREAPGHQQHELWPQPGSYGARFKASKTMTGYWQRAPSTATIRSTNDPHKNLTKTSPQGIRERKTLNKDHSPITTNSALTHRSISLLNFYDDGENNDFSQHLNRINDDDETVVDVLEMDLITEVADDEMHPSW